MLQSRQPPLELLEPDVVSMLALHRRKERLPSPRRKRAARLHRPPPTTTRAGLNVLEAAVASRPEKARRLNLSTVSAELSKASDELSKASDDDDEGGEGGEEEGKEEGQHEPAPKAFACPTCNTGFSEKGTLKAHLRDRCKLSTARAQLPEEDVPMDECVHTNLRRLSFQKVPRLRRGRPKGARRSSMGHQAKAARAGWDEEELDFDDFGMDDFGMDDEEDEEAAPSGTGSAPKESPLGVCSYCDHSILAETESLAHDGDDLLHRCISYKQVTSPRREAHAHTSPFASPPHPSLCACISLRHAGA